MTTGERIKSRRTELGMTVEELAGKLKKNRATVYRYESDAIENMSVTVLQPIAEALDTTPAWLMGWDTEQSVLSDTSDDTIAITEDDFTYALHNEAGTLTEEQKEALLGMARFFNQQLKDEGK